MNICGCLVSVTPNAQATARAQMAAMPGVEVHAASDDGRHVVVVEDTADAFASDIIMALHNIPGVYALTLNFHHFEDAPSRAPAAISHQEI